MRKITEIQRIELEHGKLEKTAEQASQGWLSAAGRIRLKRREEFLCRGTNRKMRVLEIGSGTGIQTKYLAENFDSVTGIDISPDLLQIAKMKIPGVDFIEMDAHCPDFPKNSFDLIVGVSVLHHLDWDVALKSYHKLLVPGGMLRFSEPNLMNPMVFVIKKVPAIKAWAGDSPTETAFTRWEIARSLDAAGFKSINARAFEFLHCSTPENFIDPTLKIEPMLERTFLREFGGSLLIEAVKN
jgi:ubiquinone/menaquinone biosynthesis C-methylase UbiE